MDMLQEFGLSMRLGSTMWNSSQYAHASPREQELASNAHRRHGVDVTARCRSASLAESTSPCLCELEACFCWILVCCAFFLALVSMQHTSTSPWYERPPLALLSSRRDCYRILQLLPMFVLPLFRSRIASGIVARGMVIGFANRFS
jgi:hypothetical protein